MDRSERRYRTAHKKARRLRYHWDYVGVTRGYPGRWSSGFWWGCREVEKPWQINGAWYMHEAPSAWVNRMMTRPARREQARLLHHVTHGADSDGLNWPDYRRPFVYFW